MLVESNKKRLTTNEFICKAISKHGTKYNYSKVVYVNTYSKVVIICPIHGEFEQSAKDHLKGGCKKCGLLIREQTCIDLYGVKNTFQSKEKQKKIKSTMVDRYGVEHNSLHPNTIKKRQDTCTARYGDTNALKNPAIFDKVKSTNLDRYGSENPMQSIAVKQKQQQTNLDRYGVVHTLSSPKIREKIKTTLLDLYGVDHIWKLPSVRDKIKHNFVNRTGYNHPNQQHLPTLVINQLSDKNWLTHQHHELQKTLTQISRELNVSGPSLIQQYCNKLGVGTHRYYKSDKEEQLVKFIRSVYPDLYIHTSDRTLISPLELDIYIPSLQLAIEFNGNHWHSELQGKHKQYHLTKTNKCEEQGVRLVHIFENEWVLKQDIVKSRIASLLGVNSVIYARKCSIVRLTIKESIPFFNCTHIQGSAQSSICYGLTFEGEVVAVMSFGKSRFKQGVEYELIRFSNKLGITVVGGASKLFNCFLDDYHPTSIISYSDKRWNTGNLYEQLGFVYSHSSAPNYFYFSKKSPLILQSRQLFQKHKLPKKLTNFDPELTEWENMVNNGYDRIWDCGNKVFVYTK